MIGCVVERIVCVLSLVCWFGDWLHVVDKMVCLVISGMWLTIWFVCD